MQLDNANVDIVINADRCDAHDNEMKKKKTAIRNMASGILKNNSVIWTNEQYDLNRLLSPCECILTFFFLVAL